MNESVASAFVRKVPVKLVAAYVQGTSNPPVVIVVVNVDFAPQPVAIILSSLVASRHSLLFHAMFDAPVEDVQSPPAPVPEKEELPSGASNLSFVPEFEVTQKVKSNAVHSVKKGVVNFKVPKFFPVTCVPTGTAFPPFVKTGDADAPGARTATASARMSSVMPASFLCMIDPLCIFNSTIVEHIRG